jgi:hypothetical protein
MATNQQTQHIDSESSDDETLDTAGSNVESVQREQLTPSMNATQHTNLVEGTPSGEVLLNIPGYLLKQGNWREGGDSLGENLRGGYEGRKPPGGHINGKSQAS